LKPLVERRARPYAARIPTGRASAPAPKESTRWPSCNGARIARALPATRPATAKAILALCEASDGHSDLSNGQGDGSAASTFACLASWPAPSWLCTDFPSAPAGAVDKARKGRPVLGRQDKTRGGRWEQPVSSCEQTDAPGRRMQVCKRSLPERQRHINLSRLSLPSLL